MILDTLRRLFSPSEKIKAERGFTLIELLIVIVIIGILAGVLIAVIDPAASQNRARDANVQATINKIALAAEGFNSAYGRTPTGNELLNSLGSTACLAGTSGAGCDKTGNSSYGCRASTFNDATCLFQVTGNNLPGLKCGTNANSFFGNDTAGNQCYYYYSKTGTSTFEIIARSFGLPNKVFAYNNSALNGGKMLQCDSSSSPVNTSSNATCQ